MGSAQDASFDPAGRQAAWRALISGQRRGPLAAFARAGLALLALFYRLGLAARDLRLRLPGAIKRAPRPVISIGNLTVGGTGKTPMVAWVARLVARAGARPLIVSRGYGAEPGAPNDEARELALLCPGVPHVQNADRRAGITEWLRGNPCDVVILDDGFQHRHLARDLDIVLIDALHPFGCGAADVGRLLPRGILREPLAVLRRADLVVITRADLLDAPGLARLKQTIAARLRPATPVLTARHEPTALVSLDGTRLPPDALRGGPIAAACGIGNPDAFRRTLEGLGARVASWHAFPDHYGYTGAVLDDLVRAAAGAGLKRLVTTGKDFVKWQRLLAGRSVPPAVEVAALEVTMRVVEGEEVLHSRVDALLSRAGDG